MVPITVNLQVSSNFLVRINENVQYICMLRSYPENCSDHEYETVKNI